MSEYAELISSTYNSFSIEDDIGAISRINESLQAARTLRQRRRQESRNTLLDLSRTLENLKHQLHSTKSSISIDHGTVMNNLDREKFSLAKGINDLETQTHQLESTLAKVQDEMVNMNVDAIKEPDAFGYDESTVLKLSVYRDLGIELKEEKGSYAQAIVRSRDGRDVHVVSLHQQGSESESYADHLWDLCS